MPTHTPEERKKAKGNPFAKKGRKKKGGKKKNPFGGKKSNPFKKGGGKKESK